MSKKLMMVLIPLFAVIIAAIGVLTYLLFAEPTAEDIYLENIKAAQHYLDSGDVDQAILYYKNAINADETQEEPYIKLAMTYYERKDDIKSALDILYVGYGVNNSANIKDLIDVYIEILEGRRLEEAPSEVDPSVRKGEVNSSMMDIFSSYTYGDYQSRYTQNSEQVSGGAYTVTYTQFDAVFEYKNEPNGLTVVDTVSGKPLEGARPTCITVNNLSQLITGVEQGVNSSDLITYGSKEVNLYEPSADIQNYYLSFYYGSCRILAECDSNGVINKVDGFNRIIPPATVASSTTSTLSGFVVNADDNTPIRNATMNFREGIGNRTGSIVKDVTATTGAYSVELESGDYTLEIVADGFITEFYDVYVPVGNAEINQSFVMSPVLKGNQMRFVVEWTNAQYDLYIHVKGNTSSGEYLQYWEYGSSTGNVSANIGDFRTGNQDGKRFTSATITDAMGRYEFHVHGGKDQYSKQDLINADVVVKIYKDNSSDPMIVNLPSSFPLEYWVVCSVHDGSINLID